MRNVLLFLHVLGAVLLIGPTTLASSRFTAHLTHGRVAEAAEAHRTTRTYGALTALVGVVGVALAVRAEAFGDVWVDTSLGLFVLATVLLLAVHLPAQRRALAMTWEEGAVSRSLLGRLRASAGAYALTWVVVLWLMVAKPG